MVGRINRNGRWDNYRAKGKITKQKLGEIDFLTPGGLYRINDVLYAGTQVFGVNAIGGAAYDGSKVVAGTGLTGMGSMGLAGALLSTVLGGFTGVLEVSKTTEIGTDAQLLFFYISDNGSSVVDWTLSGSSGGLMEMDADRYTPAPTVSSATFTGPLAKGVSRVAFTFDPGHFIGMSLNGGPAIFGEPCYTRPGQYQAAMFQSNNAAMALRKLTLYKPTADPETLQMLSRI